MTVGERIRKRREELGLTQTDLALRMGYKSRAAICNVEKDKEDLTTTRIRKYADALDCSPAYLMGWQEQMKTFGEEMVRQTKPITDFFKTHTVDYNRVFEALVEQYGEQDMERAIKFTRAFLSATPERQKIALEILQQSHQEDS